MKADYYRVEAKLSCGHTVKMEGLTRLKAERRVEAVRDSAFCEHHWGWMSTKIAHVQPPLPTSTG